ncbi:hypothetical protein [Paenibacillus agricola]|uniref:Uncharacterized protein n=1 Tax=Paenibacillus agricola TaxID=2716264 RepID=A0ABX0J4K2_9BACL|nr:hypothetical protein [Paenibacillus agricola]NHN30346.1 hypothetical protein [Paenibacillus agricola]
MTSSMSDLLMMMWTIIIIIAMGLFFNIVFVRQKFTIAMLRLIVKEMGLKTPIDTELRKFIAQGERKKSIKIRLDLPNYYHNSHIIGYTHEKPSSFGIRGFLLLLLNSSVR